MSKLVELREKKRVLISDGAWGTQLALRGMPAGIAPESWNLEKPDEVRTVAAGYVEAGSDIVLTNSFGGTRFKLAKNDYADKLVEANRRAVELSKEAAGNRALVFASLGPTGEFMAPLGTVSEAEMIEAFAQQVRALVEGGPDGLVLETMTDLGEARAALKAALENSDLPVVACLTFDKGEAGYATMMGVRPQQAAEELTAAGASAVGANCGAGVENMIEIVELMKPATNLPVWAKANAGLPVLEDGKTVFKQSPADFAAAAPALVEAGARIVGGCCGTTPDHIKALCAALR